ncbi:MAG TPA: hypothetical protein VGA77_02855 [Propylenella sp.]
MRWRLAAATLASLLTLISQSLAEQRVRFVGTTIITSVKNCEFTEVGIRDSSVYHVANLGDNPDFSSLSQTGEDFAVGYQLNGARFSDTFQRVIGRSIGSNGGVFDFTARIRILHSSPATGNLTPSTKFVKIEGEIFRPYGDPGSDGRPCIAGFDGAYTRRVD